MSHVWAVLGYHQIAFEAAGALQTSAGMVLLEGPPGVGKSWLAKGIGGLWKESGGSTIVVQGDSANSDLAFYPFGKAMTDLPAGWGSLAADVGAVAQAGEVLLGTAGVITATIRMVSKIRRTRRRGRTLFLGGPEQHILSELERLARKRPILLIADNLHWWDEKSLGFVRRLREPEIRSAFPFLAEMRILLVQTPPPHQFAANAAAHAALIAEGQARVFKLNRIPREGFEDVLFALGAPERPGAAAADTVYALSAGHLALARQCAARMATGDIDTFLAAADQQDFLRQLLTKRIHSLGTPGREAVAILQIAAVLGLTFRRDELTCAADKDELAVGELLRYCREEALLDLSNGVGQFVHDLYREHFLTSAGLDRVGIYERLRECLRRLRPGEYDLRSINSLNAERAAEAATLAVHAALGEERDGRAWEDLPPKILDPIEQQGLSGVVATFMAAQGHIKNYRFRECLGVLETLPPDLPKSLLAEKDFARAMCLMSTRSEHDRAAGREILEAWEGYEREEPELGVRIMQLLLYGLTHLRDKEPGRRLEDRIQRLLIERTSYDIAARDALYVLDRCSGSLWGPEIALVRNRRAVEHFKPETEEGVIRRPSEYYRCLVNLGANLISNASYEEAVTTYEAAEDLVARLPSGTFPRLDSARSNAVLAAYRAGMVDAEESVRRQREISRTLGVAADPFYVDNALAVYLALTGRLDDAIALWDGLEALLMSSRSDPEPSMVYLIRANCAATRYLAGDVARARAAWQELYDTVDRIAYAIRPILVRRHELLSEVIAAEPPPSPQEFDECLLVRYPTEVGLVWNNFGRGFRMPEIEFWRDN